MKKHLLLLIHLFFIGTAFYAQDCLPPTSLPVVAITTTSAALSWNNALINSNPKEILLVPSPTNVLPITAPPANPIIGNGTLLFTTGTTSPYILPVGTLAPGQIYFYYIRNICDTGTRSAWTTPKVFNTVVCENTDKCNYKILLSNSNAGTWNGARIVIRQNGIVVQTLGANFINATAINVPICSSVPFDVFFSVGSTNNSNLSFTLINSFQDVILTRSLATASPLSVLYNSTGNCFPVGCQKPTLMSVGTSPTSITSSIAELTWTDAITTNNWEILVTPFGAAPPVNGSPQVATSTMPTVVDNKFYYLATTNPFQATGLSASTEYQYYIRSKCSATQTSTWTILNPVKFITKPINDECNQAADLTVNSNLTCSTFATGNTLGATNALPTFSEIG